MIYTKDENNNDDDIAKDDDDNVISYHQDTPNITGCHSPSRMLWFAACGRRAACTSSCRYNNFCKNWCSTCLIMFEPQTMQNRYPDSTHSVCVCECVPQTRTSRQYRKLIEFYFTVTVVWQKREQSASFSARPGFPSFLARVAVFGSKKNTNGTNETKRACITWCTLK